MAEKIPAEDPKKIMDIFQSKNIIRSHFLPDIDHEVKHDIDVKEATFYCALSSFLNDPINETVKADSGSGKTYGVERVLSYFPQDKVHMIGKQSATAFYHDNGVLMDKNGNPINTM